MDSMVSKLRSYYWSVCRLIPLLAPKFVEFFVGHPVFTIVLLPAVLHDAVVVSDGGLAEGLDFASLV